MNRVFSAVESDSEVELARAAGVPQKKSEGHQVLSESVGGMECMVATKKYLTNC